MNGKVREKLFNEVSLVVGIIALISAIASVTLFISKPDTKMQGEITLIKNDMEHIKKDLNNHVTDLQADIGELKDMYKTNDKKIDEIKLLLERIQVQLEQ